MNIITHLKITITHNNGSIILQLRHKMCNIIDNDLVFLFYTILPLFLFKINQHPNKDYKNTKLVFRRIENYFRHKTTKGVFIDDIDF